MNDSNCVLPTINYLENIAKDLTPQAIPGFAADLSVFTTTNQQNITQSFEAVQKIVNFLVQISGQSQGISTNQSVMTNILSTVNVLVSTSAKNSWQILNNGSTSANASIALLNAIENISSNLTNTNFTINETSIQLNRNVGVVNEYSVKSALNNSSTEILIPQIPQKPAAVTVIIFTTLDNVLPARNTTDNSSDLRINADVVVVKVDETINNISFAFDINNQSLGNPQCVFWNFSLDAWDSTGCEVKTIGTGKITCECNHTTSFSILMSPFIIVDSITLTYITYIGVGISMASLIVCLIIEAIIWKSVRRNDTSYVRHVSLVNIAFSLLIADICFIVGASIIDTYQSIPVKPCSADVFFMHFFYLALFFWMLISALLLLYRTVMVLSQMSRAKMMVIAFTVGYGAPLLIAVITVASTAGPKNYVSQNNVCWLKWDESKALLAFVIPALTIVAINLVILIVVLCKMLRRRVGAKSRPDEKHTLMVIARCVAILTPIFGVTWGLGIGTMVSADFGIEVAFAVLNSLQGFFILVFGTLLDSKVREALPGKLSSLSSCTRSTSAELSSTSGQRRQQSNVLTLSEPKRSSALTSSGRHHSVLV